MGKKSSWSRTSTNSRASAQSRASARSKKLLRDWDGDSTSNEDMAYVEKELDNWFNSNTGFKSYESQQSDARAEQEVVAEEHKSGTHGDCAAWFYSNVNNADAANDAAIDDMWATIDGKMVAEQIVNAAEWQTNGWLSWDNDTVESTNKAHKSNLVAEGANASG